MPRRLRGERFCAILIGMNAEHARAFFLKLPHVVESGSATPRWGDKLVFRVGAQKDGGKMFAQFDFAEDGRAILSFAAGPEGFRELLERPRVLPAPYRARIHWVALESWNIFNRIELEELLRYATHRLMRSCRRRPGISLHHQLDRCYRRKSVLSFFAVSLRKI